jgi:hypothetical protein
MESVRSSLHAQGAKRLRLQVNDRFPGDSNAISNHSTLQIQEFGVRFHPLQERFAIV